MGSKHIYMCIYIYVYIYMCISVYVCRRCEGLTPPNPNPNPGGGNVTEPGVEPTSSGCMTGDRTTDLKRSAVISGTGIHRLMYRDICVAATAHNSLYCILLFVQISIYLYLSISMSIYPSKPPHRMSPFLVKNMSRLLRSR